MSWTGGSLKADSLGSLIASGNSGAGHRSGSEKLSNAKAATLSSLKIGGGVTGGTWTITGKTGTIAIAGAVTGWTMEGLDAGDPLTAVSSLTTGNVTEWHRDPHRAPWDR